MSKSATAPATTLVPKKGFPRFMANLRRHWQLHAMLLFPVAYLILFSYVPMYGIQIAFKDYSPRRGIPGSEWVGLYYLEYFFDYYKWPNLVANTLAISIYDLCVAFPFPIALAMVLHVYQGKTLKKVVQNISFVPHFISTVIMVGILNTVLNPVTGIIGFFNKLMGNYSYVDIRGNKDAFRHLYVWSDIWQSAGWGTILYVSALSGVPEELHEAAKIDGASRLRRVFAIDFPTILPTVALLLIMRCGGLMSVGSQKAFLMQNDMNIDTSELISTYVYKQGVRAGQLSFGAAIGLLQTVINTILVFVANWVANTLTDNEMGLF